MEQSLHKVIHAEAIVIGCNAELFVNGIPVKRVDPEKQSFVSMPVQQLLIDGMNSIELLLEPGPTPRTCWEPTGDKLTEGMEATVQLVRYPDGAYPGDESVEVLMRNVWQGSTDEKLVFPTVLKAAADMGSMYGRWLWQNAPELVLDSNEMQEIHSVLSVVHTAFGNGNPGPIIKLSSTRYREGAVAYPVRSYESIVQRFADMLERNSSKPGWVMEPLDPSAWDFRLCANGRMVEIVDRDWQATVRTKVRDDGIPFEFPFFLSRIRGYFQIVR